MGILGKKLLGLQYVGTPGPWSPLTLLSLSPSCAFVTYEKMESADQAVAEVGLSDHPPIPPVVLLLLLFNTCF